MAEELLNCSFCGASQNEQKLVTGGENKQICARCVDAFRKILEQIEKEVIYICAFCLEPTENGRGFINKAVICPQCVKAAKRTIKQYDHEKELEAI